MKKLLLATYLLGIGIISTAFGQNVNIPDANFKANLLANTFLNTNADGEIQVSEAAAYNNQLSLQGLNISDLTGIEAFTSVTGIWCMNNNLSSIDVSNCNSLVSLTCSDNQLTSLVVPNSITSLFCSNNDLSSIDLSQATLLTHLYLDNNALTGTLDLSNQTSLNAVNVQNNQLSGLNLANGVNQSMVQMYATGNPNLTCITVDNAFWSGVHWSWYVDAQTEFSEDCNSGIICTVLIPDANFKAYLLGNSAINTNSDSEIQCSEAEAFTGTINCSNLNIVSLSGIEAFVNLTQLNCSNNQIEDLSVQFNVDLTLLNCSNNQLTDLSLNSNSVLTTLNCSNNTSMTALYCNNLQLTSLLVTNNTNLTHLQCTENNLTALDVSTNTSLVQLYCYDNQITSLGVSNNLDLVDLFCDKNQISSLDLSNNTVMKTVACDQNQLTILNTTGMDSLKVLYCHNNQIASLDLSASPKLGQFQFHSNQLVTMNLANGNNANLTWIQGYNNPNLECIQVDDENYSTTNWTGSNFLFDAASTFSENCGLGLEENDLKVALYPNPTNAILNIEVSANTNCKIVNALGKTISSLQLLQGTNAINVENISPGVYFVQTNEVEIQKFVKE